MYITLAFIFSVIYTLASIIIQYLLAILFGVVRQFFVAVPNFLHNKSYILFLYNFTKVYKIK